MAYTPPSVRGGSFGEYMTVSVVFNEKHTKVKITNVDTKAEFVLSASNVPEKLPAGTWVIKLSTDKTKVLSYKPYNGLYKAKFVKFASAENTPPVAKSKHRVGKKKDGTSYDYDYLYFNPVFEIVEGEHKGLQFSDELRYNFVEVEVDGKKIAGYKPSLEKSPHTQKLHEDFETLGAYEKGVVPWKDNLLPLFEKRILNQDRTVNILFKKGWVSTIYVSDTPTEEPEASEPSTFEGTPDDDPPWETEKPDEED